jgi:HD-like signal output (HDOD) protein
MMIMAPGEASFNLNIIDKREDFLPHPPEILTRIQQLLQSGRAEARDLAKLIDSDPSLVVKILRMVNSAYYGLPRKLTDLKYAIAYLGNAEIYRIVLTASVIEQFSIPEKDFREFWFHSYLTALVARSLLNLSDVEVTLGEMWPAALLHDLGKLVAMQVIPEDYQRLVAYCDEHECLMGQAEDELKIQSHSELGAVLAEHWDLPDAVTHVCLYHESNQCPENSSDCKRFRETCRLVTAANLMSNLAGLSLSGDVRQEMCDWVCHLLDYDEKTFLLKMGMVYDLREEAEKFLNELR